MEDKKQKPTLKGATSKAQTSKDYPKRLKDITARLSKDKDAAALLDEAKKAGFKIRMAKGIGVYGGADPDKKFIILNTDYNNGVLIGTLAHELRHIHQYGRGAYPDIENLTAKSYLMQNRAMEADAQAFATAVCYNLAGQGDAEPLKEFAKNDAPIVNAFQKDIAKGEDEAKFSAFKAWYQNHKIVDIYDSFQADDLQNIDDYDEGMFATKLSAKQIVGMICDNGTKKGSYFKASPNLLETPEFITISDVNKANIKEILSEDILREDFGVCDNSINKLPTRKDARKKASKTTTKVSNKQIINLVKQKARG